MSGIVEIIGEVVKEMEKGLTITYPHGEVVECPRLTYIFGNAQYVKDKLDEYSQSDDEVKFPLVVLFCPVKESRNSSAYRSRVQLNLILACSSDKEWSNEQRLEYSFRNILRPMYDRLLEVLKCMEDRFLIEYDGNIPHDYLENYSYGRYGAYTESGEEVSEPIDAINIRSMELIVKNHSCR